MNGPIYPTNGGKPQQPLHTGSFQEPDFESEFDRLAWLACHDPVAFDAERKARLTIALAQSRQSSPSHRELINDMDKILAPLAPHERAWVAMRSMTLSLVQLNELLQGLSSGLTPKTAPDLA
jgi:hypothetical protein